MLAGLGHLVHRRRRLVLGAWIALTIFGVFATGSDAYVSRDRHTTFAEIYPAGTPDFSSTAYQDETQAALRAATPAGVTVHLTGRDPLQEASSGGSGGPSVLTEAMIGGAGALIIL